MRTLFQSVALCCVAISSFLCCQTQIFAQHEKADDNGLTAIKDPDDLYGKGNVEVDFETDAEGKEVKPKQKLNDLYLPVGVTFESESELKGTSVIAFRFNCKGRSEIQSAGVSFPPFAGNVKIVFHKPGDAKSSATITKFGLYLANVRKDGTSIEAYDSDDKLIGKLVTQKPETGSEFLAASSEAPIAYLRIIANKDIDDDFAFDDLVFDNPSVVEKEK